MIGFQPVGESTWLCGRPRTRIPGSNSLNTAVCTDAGPRRAVGGAVSHLGVRQAGSSSPRRGVGFQPAGRKRGWRSERRSKPPVARGDVRPRGSGGRTIGLQPVGESTWRNDRFGPRSPSRNSLNTAFGTDAGPRLAVGGAVSHLGGEQVKNLFYGRTLGRVLLFAARYRTWVFDKLEARRHVGWLS
jgi:hypothetical protein